MEKKVIAVIGCGRIAQSMHFPAFGKIEGLRVKYACDLIIEKAEKMRDKYEYVEEVITDYKIALGDPEIDAVLSLPAFVVIIIIAFSKFT